jgi:hypothetical protein
LIAGAVCVGVAVEVLLVLLLTMVLSVDDVLVRVWAVTDDVEVLDLRDDELVSFELVDDFVEDEDDDFVLLEVLTDFDVDVLVEEGLTELVVDVFDVVEVCTDVELDEVLTVTVPILYISRRFPAPQYSNSFPGQTIEQSLAAARTEPVLMTLPQ